MFPLFKVRKQIKFFCVLEVRLVVTQRRVQVLEWGTRRVGLLRCGDVLLIGLCAGGQGYLVCQNLSNCVLIASVRYCHDKHTPKVWQTTSKCFLRTGLWVVRGLGWAPLALAQGCRVSAGLLYVSLILPYLVAVQGLFSYSERQEPKRGERKHTGL